MFADYSNMSERNAVANAFKKLMVEETQKKTNIEEAAESLLEDFTKLQKLHLIPLASALDEMLKKHEQFYLLDEEAKTLNQETAKKLYSYLKDLTMRVK